MRYDMLSLGPARMDVFVKLPDEVTEWCSIDRKKCTIELGFGEKIAVKSVNFAVGGNTGNNAVGLARLGLSVAMAGTMGDSWSDKWAWEILKKERIDVKYVCIDPGKSGFGVVINYQEERTILSYYAEGVCSFPTDAELSAGWIYLTTAGERFEEFYRQAVDWAKSRGAKIAFNPGSRQIKAGVEPLGYAYGAAEILFVNREEAAHLLKLTPDVEVKKLLEGLAALGPRAVVITDGPGGTYLYDGSKYWHMPIVPALVVERTGAGDAFGSGFLAAILSGRPYEEALRWGTVNSASVLGYIGPQAGLLNRQQMEEELEKSKLIQPREI